MNYRIIPVPAEFAHRIRTTLRDDAGNALSVWTSDSHGNPCRSCLRVTHPGERLILCAYTPFESTGPYVESGPIFIHADACDGYDPSAGSTERGILSIVAAEVAPAGAAAPALARLFGDPRASFVHARNPSWGCYDFRLERPA